MQSRIRHFTGEFWIQPGFPHRMGIKKLKKNLGQVKIRPCGQITLRIFDNNREPVL
jgi:hypothetical protein